MGLSLTSYKVLRISLTLNICLWTGFFSFVFGQSELTKRSWTAGELWAQSITEGLVFSGNAIVLDQNQLIEKDAPGIGSIRSVAWDTISPGKIIRKQLAVTAFPVNRAIVTMMIYPVTPASGGKLEFRINGHQPIVYEVRHAWTQVPIPAVYLKTGKNIIEIRVQTKGAVFRIPTSLYNNSNELSSAASEKSTDNGKSWIKAQNEYPIRIKLYSNDRRGVLQTPVINLTDPAVAGILLKPTHIENVKFSFKISSSANSRQVIRFRSGNTHQPAEGGWTGWQLLSHDYLPEEFQNRFIQFEISFEKNSNNGSPLLEGLTIDTRWRFSDPSLWKGLTVKEAVNKPVVHQSYQFKHEDPSFTALKEFREKFQLDKLIEGASTELEKIKRLRGWVAGLWNWYLPDPELPDMVKWDAREILNPVDSEGKPGKTGGFCLYYAIVFAQACQSMGIPARIVTINYSIWGGHEVTEVWSREYEKWIMMDAQFDAMFYERKTGIPCNALELHRVFLDTYYPGNESIDRDKWTIRDRDWRAEKIDPHTLPIQMEMGGNANGGRLNKDYTWWKVVADSISPGYSGGYGFFNTAELRWFPRSNWLSQPTPMPVTHGRTHWGWDGYLCWTDEKTPESPEHRYFVRRSSDIYGNLFTVDFSLQPLDKGILQLNMTTESPGFRYFEITRNGDKILLADSVYEWKLLPGVNRLELRTVDVLGNRGPLSKAIIDYSPGE